MLPDTFCLIPSLFRTLDKFSKKITRTAEYSYDIAHLNLRIRVSLQL